MAYQLEIPYYNSFWLKHTTTPKIEDAGAPNNAHYIPLFPGAPWLGSSNGYPNWVTTGGSAAPVRSNVYNGSAIIYNADLGTNWMIEENRIRGGYNNEAWGLSPRAYLREDSNDVRHRNNALIYSGIFNSKTNINETNVFNSAQDITRAIDPHNGSVQLIDVLDNNLTIYQENKVSQALVDKDAIYSAEGQPLTTRSNLVIGQVTPYVGDYGISTNPESFAKFGFRRYFVDRCRNSVMRLSRDGLTPISNYGMNDYFRDELSRINDSIVSYISDEYSLASQTPPFPYTSPFPSDPVGPYIEIAIAGSEDGFEIETGAQLQFYANSSWYDTNITVTGTETNGAGTSIQYIYLTNASLGINVGGVNYAATKVRFLINKIDSIQGGYDRHKDNYIISIQERSGSKTDDLTSNYYSTVAFDDNIKGWTTFYTYRPSFIFSLKNNTYTTFNDSLYEHYTNNSYNNFYGVYNDSSVELVLNDNPSIMKNFKTINYQGSDGWEVNFLTTDNEGPSFGGYTDIASPIKSYQESLYTTGGIEYRSGFNLKENKFFANIINNSQVQQNEVNFGNQITGVKGFFAVLKLSTDSTTRLQQEKQLFSVGSEIVLSSK
jgi:hypothetical protein